MPRLREAPKNIIQAIRKPAKKIGTHPVLYAGFLYCNYLRALNIKNQEEEYIREKPSVQLVTSLR